MGLNQKRGRSRGARGRARLAVWQEGREGRLGEAGHLNQELLWAKGCSGGQGASSAPSQRN